MDTYILCEDNPILGRVEEHVTKFECQGRGSLHAHLLLWIAKDHVDWVTNHITATSPGELSPNGTCRIRPVDPMVRFICGVFQTVLSMMQNVLIMA